MWRAADLLGLTVQTLALQEDDLETSCPRCRQRLTLAEARVGEEGGATVYRCQQDREIVVLIAERGAAVVMGSGYRLGELVLQNRADLTFSPFGTPNKVLLPACPKAPGAPEASEKERPDRP
jgi:hypothetical protein